MKVEFLHCVPLHIVATAIRECYDSHDKSDSKEIDGKIVCGSKDAKLIEKVGNVNKHSSTLEHLVFNIRIQDVSRLLLQEFARHRIASLSVKSTRFTLQELKSEPSFVCKTTKNKYKDRVFKYIVVPSRDHFNSDEEYEDNLEAQTLQLELLRKAIASGMKRDVAKYRVPDSYKTNIAWTINARSLQNFLKLRTAKNAHFEIRELANLVYNNMPDEYKYLFTDFVE